MKRDPLLVFIAVVASLMIYATLYPFRFEPFHVPFLDGVLPETRRDWLDVIVNVYFFMPLGLLCGLRFRTFLGSLLSFLTLTGISLIVEMAQAYIPGRHSSLRDLALNSLGGLCGLLLAHLPIFVRELIPKRFLAAISQTGTLTLISLWVISQYFPFIPLLRISAIQRFLQAPGGSEFHTFENLEILAFSSFTVLIWRQKNSLSSTAIFTLTFSMLVPMQVLLWGRTVTIEQVGASLAGLWLGLVMARSKTFFEPRFVAAVALALLVWRELQPFSWNEGSLSAFNWLPFRVTFEINRDGAIHIVALKCFSYWLTVSQIQKALRIPILIPAAGVACFLFLGELGQCFQPTRTPEITDPLLCLLVVLPIWGLEELPLRVYSEPQETRSG